MIARFNEFVVPKLPSLRKAVIQNDANEQNVLTNATCTRITGIFPTPITPNALRHAPFTLRFRA